MNNDVKNSFLSLDKFPLKRKRYKIMHQFNIYVARYCSGIFVVIYRNIFVHKEKEFTKGVKMFIVTVIILLLPNLDLLVD